MEEDLKKKAAKDPKAKKSLEEIRKQLEEQAKNGDPVAIAKLREFDSMRRLASLAAGGDANAIN